MDFEARKNINIVDKNSFVVEVSLIKNLGKIMWCSDNTE